MVYLNIVIQRLSQTLPFRHALPVSEMLFHEPIYLTHAGWEMVQPLQNYLRNDPPFFHLNWAEGRTLPEFCLALNLTGIGEYQTKHFRGRIQPGEVFFYQPGEWHRHRPLANTGWTIMWIHFNGDVAIRWMKERAFQTTNNIICPHQPELFHAQFERLICSVHKQPGVNSRNLSYQALGLLSHIVQEQVIPNTRRDHAADEVVQQVVEHIWNFSHGMGDVSALAAQVGIPRRTLDRRFRSVMGRSILDEIQLCRISRATQLLKETDIPLKHIVYRAGFGSHEHLRLAFQKTYGKSPLEYRNQIRKSSS